MANESVNKQTAKPTIPLLDIGEADNRKKILELIQQGSILYKDNKGPYVVEVQYGDLYDGDTKVIHKIYLKDIIGISVSRYYEDIENVQPQFRRLIRTVIWCRHRGYNVESKISAATLEKLLNEGYITKDKITFNDIDANSGKGYYSVNGTLSLEDIKKEEERRNSLLKKKKEAFREGDNTSKELTLPKVPEKNINRTPKRMTKEEVAKDIFKDTNVNTNISNNQSKQPVTTTGFFQFGAN